MNIDMNAYYSDLSGLPVSRYIRRATEEDDYADANAIRKMRRNIDDIESTALLIGRETDEQGRYREPEELAGARDRLPKAEAHLEMIREIADGREKTGEARRRYEDMQLRLYGRDIYKDERYDETVPDELREVEVRIAERWDQKERRGVLSELERTEQEVKRLRYDLDSRRTDWETCTPTYQRWREITQPVPVTGLTPVPAEHTPTEQPLDMKRRLAWQLVTDPAKHSQWFELDAGRPLTAIEARTLAREWHDITLHGRHLEFETSDQTRDDGHHVLIRYTPISQ